MTQEERQWTTLSPQEHAVLGALALQVLAGKLHATNAEKEILEGFLDRTRDVLNSYARLFDGWEDLPSDVPPPARTGALRDLFE